MQSTQWKLNDTGCDDPGKLIKQSSFKVKKTWGGFNPNNLEGKNSLVE